MNKMEIVKTSKVCRVFCDKCGYEFDAPFADLKRYIGLKCPKCGDVMLTKSDYKSNCLMRRYIRIINILFGWIALFYRAENPETYIVTNHNGGQINVRRANEEECKKFNNQKSYEL